MEKQDDFCRRLYSGAFCSKPPRGFDRDFRPFLNQIQFRTTVRPAEARRGQLRGCQICIDLQRAFEATYSEYVDACFSASYQFTTKFAAHKNVDMERARNEMEEHRFVCASAFRLTTVQPSSSARDLIDESIDHSDAETAEPIHLALAS